jgi:NAD(P)H-dependent flavin oxidoreductase YrpB (nitropropane dioxygenase family)
MLTTRFTELGSCSVPIQQAGMGGGIATPRVAAATANAGGLGMVSVYGAGYTPAVVVQLSTARGSRLPGQSVPTSS